MIYFNKKLNWKVASGNYNQKLNLKPIQLLDEYPKLNEKNDIFQKPITTL